MLLLLLLKLKEVPSACSSNQITITYWGLRKQLIEADVSALIKPLMTASIRPGAKQEGMVEKCGG